jgi:tetratricopeptide (TPR) repeat protein
MRVRPLLAAFAVLLVAGPIWAAPEKKEEKKAETAVDRAKEKAVEAYKKGRTEAFAEYETQLSSGQKARAADALVAILDNPVQVAWHAEAAAKLGDLFVELQLPYAALTAYVKAFRLLNETVPPDVLPEVTADLGGRVGRAIELADKVGDMAILEEPFSRNLGLARTEDDRGKMAYLAAREAFRQESYGLAIGLLKMVKEGDPMYPEAKMLEGIILSQQGRFNESLVPFQAAQKAGRDKSERFNNMLMLNIGRAFYGGENFARSVQAFAAIPHESSFWPEAQFERAWAHFRLADYNGTLGVLFSLSSPFFEDWYYPEADLLRVYSMFYLCKFPQANIEIESFKVRYKPIHEALVAWSSKSPAENFQAAREFVRTGKSEGLPVSILRPYAAEDRFLASVAAVESVEEELKRMKNVAANPFTERAKKWLEERRNELVEGEGKRIKDRVAYQEVQVGEMLINVEIFIVDILRMKAILYEQAAATGRMPEAAVNAEREARLRKNQVEWPFEGEFWADEVGYYQVDAPPECPASLRGEMGGK